MILQLKEITPMLMALSGILEKELPAKTAYWLARAQKGLVSEFEPFEAARKKLVNRYAKKDETGEAIVDGDHFVVEDMDALNAEFAELSDQEVEIKYNPISIEQLGDINIKPVDVLRLGRLIKDEDDEEEDLIEV